MEKKQATQHQQAAGMCEKIFNAFQPALRPLRRITYGYNQQHGPTTNSGTVPHKSNAAKTDTKLPEPVAPKHEITAVKKKEHMNVLPVPSAPKAEIRPLTMPVPEKVRPRKEKPAVKKATVQEKKDEYVALTKGKVQNAMASVKKAAATSKRFEG